MLAPISQCCSISLRSAAESVAVLLKSASDNPCLPMSCVCAARAKSWTCGSGRPSRSHNLMVSHAERRPCMSMLSSVIQSTTWQYERRCKKRVRVGGSRGADKDRHSWALRSRSAQRDLRRATRRPKMKVAAAASTVVISIQAAMASLVRSPKGTSGLFACAAVSPCALRQS